jgi:type IV pilus assembly protein PilA
MLRKALNKKKKGFTLIELIIVIAIIAILAAVALPKFMEMRENANIKADIATAKNLNTVVSALVADNKLSTNQNIDVTAGNGTITGQLQDTPAYKASTIKGQHVWVRIDANGDVSVYHDSVSSGTEIYPHGQGIYVNN